MQGDNQNRISGQSNEFKQLNIHAWEAFEKGQDIHLQAAPSQAELLYREFKVKKDTLKTQTKEDIMDKYGNAAAEDKPPMELLLGQTERQVEYDQAGRIIKGQVCMGSNTVLLFALWCEVSVLAFAMSSFMSLAFEVCPLTL